MGLSQLHSSSSGGNAVDVAVRSGLCGHAGSGWYCFVLLYWTRLKGEVYKAFTIQGADRVCTCDWRGSPIIL